MCCTKYIYITLILSGKQDKEGKGGVELNKKTRLFFFFMYNSPDNVYSDDLTTPKRTK